MKILCFIQKEVNRRIEKSEEVYVVFFNMFNKEVFVCPNGQEALKLVDTIKAYHEATNKTFIQIFYGKASEVFRYKHLKVLDCKFTWNATSDEKQAIFQHMADSPLRNKKEEK